MALFALDHNYPAPIIEQAKPYLSNVDLVCIEEIDPQLPEFEDWELLLALHHHSQRTLLPERLLRSLRPGGSLAELVAEATPTGTSRSSPRKRSDSVP